MTNRMYKRLPSLMVATAVILLCSASLHAQSPTRSLEDILRAHRAWQNPPISVEISGTSTRGEISTPVKITVTKQEDVAFEYGEKKQVLTRSRVFKDDGSKTTYASTPAGFTQLDVTSVFLLSELRFRAARTSEPVEATFGNHKYTLIHVSDPARSELHHGQLRVHDEVDLYIDAQGRLAGLARTFYKELPRFTVTQAYAFSDYRETNGTFLPYRIEKYVKGKKVETIDVNGYAVDVPVSNRLFEAKRRAK